MPLIRWFLELPKHRKVLLILTGGMLTLVFDAFIGHFQWNRGSMKWNQWIPVIYGLAAFALMTLPSLFQLSSKAENWILNSIGLVGLVVGSAGVVLHTLSVLEALEGEDALGIVVIGKALKLAPPVFAPAAFAGVGLLLICLKRLCAAPVTAAHLNRHTVGGGESAQVIALGER